MTYKEEKNVNVLSTQVKCQKSQCIFWPTYCNLHIHLGVVDEVLQRISTRIVILQLCVVGDCPDGGVKRSDYPAHIDRLDVGEVREYSRPWCTCGLWNYLTET